MRLVIVFMVLFAVVSLASAAYTPEQQVTLEGTRLSFLLGQAYQQAQQGQNIAGFNTLVDQWNAWVRTNFGEDANLLMQKVAGPVDLSKPYVSGKNTSNTGIVHSIGGSGKYGPQYTTNDVNLLPENVRMQYNSSSAQWLGGV